MNKKIILVEDDKVSFESICQTLHRYHYRCLGCQTLNEAKDMIKREVCDLIICDIWLPDGSGLQLLKDVRQFLLNIPFVVITASDKKELILQALKEGADDFLSKPFHMDNLPTIIERNIQRRRLIQKEYTPKKPTVLLKTIQALITALEAKDSFTSGHSMRVARHAKMMGEALGLSGEEKFILEFSAILHDIGKIGMPDNILKKSSSLLEMEYNTAKEHVIIGSRIVGKIDELKEVAAIIRHHHERYDGRGYPDGLKGDVIPYFSRILSIADAYESIVSGRTYSESHTSDQALDELKKNAGTQFDPGLVDIFIRAIRSASSNPNTPLQIELMSKEK